MDLKHLETALMSGENFLEQALIQPFFEGLLDVGAEVKWCFICGASITCLRACIRMRQRLPYGPHRSRGISTRFPGNPATVCCGTRRDRVVVRPYNAKFWPGEPIGQDFFSAIGLPHLWGAMRKPAGPINESLSRPEIYVLSVTEGIAEKQRLMDHFRARPFANCGRAKFFRSPDFRVDFNLRYLVLNSGVAALNGGVDITEFLDLANVDDDPHWQALDPNDPQIVDYLETFRAKHSDSDGGIDWEVQ
ncbi:MULTISPECIES: hypothetical protein [unclassified Mesorhizobium]|uniref:hypothetical protein n=1 Tax=unclassified Mesorhizobium TaxID=325217 RepID=UPI0012EC61CE|nr:MULTISPECIES: hypothetical protein [unclassified Mesorhizobium]WJI76966.1 hypothetical protein NLY37_09825 [Mesorhizobium sp. C395A]